MIDCVINNQCSTNRSHTTEGGEQYCNRHYLQMRRHGRIVDTSREKRAAIIEGDVAKIPLGINAKDGYAIVDKEYAYLADKNWRKTHYGYAIRSEDKILLHRAITSANNDEVVDHANGDPLDNRRVNLRLCTQGQNVKNQKVKKNNTTGVKGVCIMRGKYVARIKVNYKNHWLGSFEKLEDAAKAYREAAIKYHGEFARFA